MSSNKALTPRSQPGTDGAVLWVEDLHGGYGKKEILRGVSLEVRSGEIVTLIGPNGAGKSTFLKAVSGLLRLTSGRVFLNGRDLTALPPHRRAVEGLAYLMQDSAIFPSLTVKDHLALGSRAGGRRPAQEGWQPPGDLVMRREPAGFFSGGERHAVALATVLARPPVLLLCDEPSAGLSPAVAKEAFQRIQRLARERHLPVLCWVEQRVGDVLPLVDRAILLREGRIVAETREPLQWLSAEVLAELTFGDAQP